MASKASTIVLVTGGTGFIGSHVILQLLQQGYTVRTTVRSFAREAGLRDGLSSGGATADDLARLSFFEADLQKDDGWNEAVSGTTYVHHVASPFPVGLPKHEDELIIPAREGTLRVLKAAHAAKVKRVILTSSVAAVAAGHPPQDAAFTEKDWTILDSAKPVPAYPKSKTLAERAAWDFVAGEGAGLELTTVNPVIVLGPILQAEAKTSVQIIKKLMDGSVPGCPALYISAVDVRDVASLHILAMTTPSAAGERFIAVADDKPDLILNIAKIIREKRPDHAKKVPTLSVPSIAVRILSWFDASLRQILPDLGHMTVSSNEKAKTQFDWKPRSVKESVLDTADSLIKFGII